MKRPLQTKQRLIAAKRESKKYEAIKAAIEELKDAFVSGEIDVGYGHTEQITDCDALIATVQDHLGSIEAHIDDLENEQE